MIGSARFYNRSGTAWLSDYAVVRCDPPGPAVGEEWIVRQAVLNSIDVSFFGLFFLASHFGVCKVLISNQ